MTPGGCWKALVLVLCCVAAPRVAGFLSGTRCRGSPLLVSEGRTTAGPASGLGKLWAVSASSPLVTSLEGRDDYEAQVGEGQVPQGELVVVKFWAPWCRACKNLEPKYKHVASQYPWAEFKQLNWEENREFCKELGVAALPMVKIFTNQGEVESFACGPKKVELLRAKLDEWRGKVGVEQSPAEAGTVLTGPEASQQQQAAPQAEEDAAAAAAAAVEAPPAVGARRSLEPEALRQLCMPLFANLTSVQLGTLLDRAVELRFRDGEFIIEEGDVGRRFFVILDGEVDIYQQQGYGGLAESPWGTPVNRLRRDQYFGEKALLTGQPRHASVAAASETVVCLAIEKTTLEEVDPEHWIGHKFRPPVWGMEVGSDSMSDDASGLDVLSGQLKATYLTPASDPLAPQSGAPGTRQRMPMILRVKLLRTALRGFEHAAKKKPNQGDSVDVQFRRRLVAQLSDWQLAEFREAFALLDRDNNGAVDARELGRALKLFQGSDSKLDDSELKDIINKANPGVDGNTVLQEDEFVAMLAEAEYTELFLEAFKMLDTQGTGWVEGAQVMKLLQEFQEQGGVHTEKILSLMKQFGIDDDGHVDYAAFVDLLMSTPA